MTNHSRKSLRVLGSVGEPINPSAWRLELVLSFKSFIHAINWMGKFIQWFTNALSCRWFFNLVGDSRCPISDTWWQTETGGFMVDSLLFRSLCLLIPLAYCVSCASNCMAVNPIARCLAAEAWFSYFPFLWCSGLWFVVCNFKLSMLHCPLEWLHSHLSAAACHSWWKRQWNRRRV